GQVTCVAASRRDDPGDAYGEADAIRDLKAMAGLEGIAHHGFGADACDMSLAVRILDVGEEDVPRDLAVDTDRLNLLENAVARSFKHDGFVVSGSSRSAAPNRVSA